MSVLLILCSPDSVVVLANPIKAPNQLFQLVLTFDPVELPSSCISLYFKVAVGVSNQNCFILFFNEIKILRLP